MNRCTILTESRPCEDCVRDGEYRSFTKDLTEECVGGRIMKSAVMKHNDDLLRVCVRGKRKMSNVLRADDVDGSWCRANHLFCDVKGREYIMRG